MKFVVPLTIPWMRSTRAPASDSCSTRMTGTTPATAPSKRSWTCARARVSTAPRRGRRAGACSRTRRACRPASRCSTYSRAGSIPPISSTIRSEPSRISSKSPRERVSTPLISGRRPVMCAIASARSLSSCSNAAPTVPCPSSPTLYVSAMQVLEGLAAHDQPCLAVCAEHDRRPRDAVVVVGHRVHVGAGDRRRRGCRRRAARAASSRGSARRRTRSACRRPCTACPAAPTRSHQIGLVRRVVEHRAHVVRHPAVDARRTAPCRPAGRRP